MNKIKIKKIVKYKPLDVVIKAMLGFFLLLTVIFIILIFVFSFSPIKNKAKDYGVTILQEQLNCDVSIGELYFGFRKNIEVEELLISKNKADTLLYLRKLAVSFEILPLFRHKIIAQEVELEGFKGDVEQLLQQVSDNQTEEDASPKVESNSWEFMVDNLIVKSSYMKYRDEDIGFELIVDVGELSLEVGTLNLDTLIYCKNVDIHETKMSYESLYTEEDNDTTTFEFADIRLGNAVLNNVIFTYIDSTSSILFSMQSADLEVKDLLVDITKEKVSLNKGIIKNTHCSVAFLPNDHSNTQTDDDSNWGQYLWRVEGEDLELEGFKFTLNYQGRYNAREHFNSDHLNIYDLDAKLIDFIIDDSFCKMQINHLSGKEHNGLNIMAMQGHLNQHGSLFSIEDMDITTSNSSYRIQLETDINPTNYNELRKKDLNLNLIIKSLNWNDIDYFYPFIEKYNFLSEDFVKSSFKLHTQLDGGLDNLRIKQFEFYNQDSIQLFSSGKIGGLLGDDSIYYDMQIAELMCSKNDLEFALEAFPIISPYSIPDFVILKGNLTGGSSNYHFLGEIESSVGQINVKELDISLSGVPKYIFNVSACLKNLSSVQDLGFEKANFELQAMFEGNDFTGSNSTIDLDIDQIRYNNYDYNNIFFEEQMFAGQFDANLFSLDTNLLFNIKANGVYLEDNQMLNLDINAKKIDLFTLNILDEEFIFDGQAVLNAEVSKGDNYKIISEIENLNFTFGDTIYNMHPADLSFITANKNTEFHLSSFYYNLDFTADDHLSDFIGSVESLPNYYFQNAKDDSVKFTLPVFNVNGKIKYPEAFARLFFPDYPEFDELTINGGYDKNLDKIDFNVLLPGLRYQSLHIDGLSLSLKGSSKKLEYLCQTNMEIDNLLKGKMSLFGTFSNSDLISGFRYYDSFDNKYLDLRFRIDPSYDGAAIHILSDSLILNYDQWNIDNSNYLILHSDHFLMNKLELHSKDQTISFSSSEKKAQSLNLKLDNINLENLEQLFITDTLVAAKLSADINFTNIYHNPAINGQLSLKDVDIFGFDAGELSVSKLIYKDDLFSVDMAIQGDYEDIHLSGDYDLKAENNPFDIELDIKKLDLSKMNYLLSDYIVDAKGILNGNLGVQGNIENPIINGELSFSDTGLGVVFLNNYFTLGNEKIVIQNNVIDFEEFSIINKQNQTAKLIGKLSFDKTSGYYSNLQLKTDNIEIMNSTKEDNEVLFGLLKAQANVDIKGSSGDLNLDAQVVLDHSTDLTYVFPESLVMNDNQGVVRFCEYKCDSIKEKEKRKYKKSANFSKDLFKEIKSQIIIDNGTHFKLYFDNGGENYLNATLNGSMNYNSKGENTVISGIFEVQEGDLHYSIPMITVKKYKIEPGSFISLSNDIYNPHVNIIASSEVRASTEGLIPDYNKVMIFKVFLYMNGELNNVKLKFGISSETNDAIVSARIAQLSEKEKNINALNLLARGSFVISINGSDAGGTSMVAAQVDNFYARQLNHLIGDNLHFVDLNFDVQSYMDYGESGEEVFRRNYYYNVGKSFFKDRARIKYKGSLGLASDVNAKQSVSNFVQNELEVEVKITKDGRFRTVFFRKDKYEGLLEGEVIETGGGIRYRKSFYSVKDIFVDLEKQKKQKDKKN